MAVSVIHKIALRSTIPRATRVVSGHTLTPCFHQRRSIGGQRKTRRELRQPRAMDRFKVLDGAFIAGSNDSSSLAHRHRQSKLESRHSVHGECSSCSSRLASLGMICRRVTCLTAKRCLAPPRDSRSWLQFGFRKSPPLRQWPSQIHFVVGYCSRAAGRSRRCTLFAVFRCTPRN